MQVGVQPSHEMVLRTANICLAEENLSYQEVVWRLEHTLEERDRIAAELHSELTLAREVQNSLLPYQTEQFDGLTGLNMAAKSLSGDFYDFYRLVDGRIIFCLADVSGKGMHAALLMAKSASLFRCLCKGIHDPAKLLSMLNLEIAETAIRGMFVTMLIGVYEPESGEVLLANAGHPPALQMSENGLVAEYPAGAPPLGIDPGGVFPTYKFMLRNDCLYLYTDGLLEARIADQRLEREGLLQLLQTHAQVPLRERATAIAHAVLDVGGHIDDDLTIVIIDGAVQHRCDSGGECG